MSLGFKRLNEEFIKTLVALLTQLTVCAIYSHGLVWVRSTHIV